MSRILPWSTLALALAVTGCGPDCHGYCDKLVECTRAGLLSVVVPGNCVTACEETQADDARIIGCVNSHSCPDIAAGHCSVTGRGFAP